MNDRPSETTEDTWLACVDKCLKRASKIDPEAWETPLRNSMQKRRNLSYRDAMQEVVDRRNAVCQIMNDPQNQSTPESACPECVGDLKLWVMTHPHAAFREIERLRAFAEWCIRRHGPLDNDGLMCGDGPTYREAKEVLS